MRSIAWPEGAPHDPSALMYRTALLLLALLGGRTAAGQPDPHAAAVDSVFGPVDRPDGPGCAVGV
ncbi:hypothetical protein BSZ37_12615 [Rubrivirga marina]|uniref:Uncharacterized protein n=1 Tax=Rubrivirga marina TaxID=1196024 RepID=A0A271J2D5_9BACT|nr:hypothetical protein BSZ37_12615 [Rubrivirga marina]